MGSEDDPNTALHLQHHQPHNLDFDFDYPNNNNDDDLLEPTSLSDPNLDPYEEEGAESEHIYNVAMDALHEAIRKVAAAKRCGSALVQTTVVNGSQQLQSCSLDEDEKIQELTAELEQASQRCEAYRTKLLCVMKDMEEWKLRISVKVQNVRLKMKD
ncbi:hypothetical protein D5086_011774 [Populus alba]|uniref:Uncharacterized protein n=1 Tax=Populus alba TaxID=43335 RepID=A0ACC4CDV3_POPAL